MSFFIVDVEADGPIPGTYSMLEFAAVKLTPKLETTYYSGKIKPITDYFEEEALRAIGADRKLYIESGREPQAVMKDFENWLKTESKGRPIFMSDNVAFDWQFINWYFHNFINANPFGYSGRRIGDLYCGLKHDMYATWKYLRTTRHTHHPLDDAMGNAEAMLRIRALGLQISLDSDKATSETLGRDDERSVQ